LINKNILPQTFVKNIGITIFFAMFAVNVAFNKNVGYPLTKMPICCIIMHIDFDKDFGGFTHG